MSKCIKCNLKKITNIQLYYLTVQKCKDCGYIRTFFDDFDIIIYKILLKKNIGNIAKYNNIYDCNKYEKKLIDDFLNVFKDIKDINLKVNKLCDVCNEKLNKKTLMNKFEYFYCEYCKSIYFLHDDLENFINYLIKYIERKNFMFKVYFNISSKIKFKLFKIKEIFHRKVKNNVKK